MNLGTASTQTLKLVALSIILSNCAPSSDKALFQKVLALAEQGNSQAQYNLGMMFNNGIGTEKDPNKAFDWFKRAADSGDPLGAYKVGCYYGGQFEGTVPIDKEKSQQFKLIAATAGYSRAQHDVGIIFYAQKKVPDALHWWGAAAEQGYPMSLYNLSVVYNEGKDVSKDIVRAYALFKLSKLRSEGQINSNAQASLDQLKNKMSVAEIEQAESIVSAWEVKPTPLTVRAAEGIEEAKKLVKDKRK